MPPVRVVVLDLPTLIREMIEDAVRECPDTVLIEHPPSDDPEAIGEAAPDALITGVAADELSRIEPRAMGLRPNVRVVTVSVRTGRAVVYASDREALVLGDVSPTEIVAAIVASHRAGRSSS